MENNATEPSAESMTYAPAALSPFEFDLDTAAKLGTKAAGIEIVALKTPDGIAGVPAEIPVALRRGDDPAINSVATLFETYRQFPQRKTGQAVALTFETFCDLVNRHRTDHSAIFADTAWRNPAITAVIDYHENKNGGQADNGKHRIHYAFPLSDEWKAWNEMNGQAMKQEEFAWFLEDRVAELSSPTDHEKATYEAQFAATIATPAQVVELSRGLKLTVDTRVKSAVTLQSGEGQIAWEETHNGADGKPIKVPGLFMLYIAPFFMGDKIRVPVRLRYRIKEGATTWFYQIYRPDLAITEHVRDTLAEARARTELPTYEGKPEISL